MRRADEHSTVDRIIEEGHAVHTAHSHIKTHITEWQRGRGRQRRGCRLGKQKFHHLPSTDGKIKSKKPIPSRSGKEDCPSANGINHTCLLCLPGKKGKRRVLLLPRWPAAGFPFRCPLSVMTKIQKKKESAIQPLTVEASVLKMLVHGGGSVGAVRNRISHGYVRMRHDGQHR